jgi:hypothetical protein
VCLVIKQKIKGERIMSKWVSKDLFKEFTEEKKNETQNTFGGAFIDKK